MEEKEECITLHMSAETIRKAEKYCKDHGTALAEYLCSKVTDLAYEAEFQPEKDETLAERLKRENYCSHTLTKELMEREERTRDGYLLQVVKALGRPLTADEMRDLGNIL